MEAGHMEDVISKEAAELELKRIMDTYEVDPDGDGWADSKARLLAAIGKGRITLNESKCDVVMTLLRPITLENNEDITFLVFSEPTAGDLKILDKYKSNEGMLKTIHLASRMTGQPVTIIERMGARDLQTMGAIASLFF
jgi:hypothetical protein